MLSQLLGPSSGPKKKVVDVTNDADTNLADKPAAHCDWGKNQVLFQAPAALHDELAELIDAWHHGDFTQICVNCRLITSARELASAAGIPWQTLQTTATKEEQNAPPIPRGEGTVVQAATVVAESPPVFVVELTDEQVKAMFAAAVGDNRTKIVYAPKITIFNGQQAMISDCTQHAFVTGLESGTNGGLKPRIETLEEGIKIKLRAIASADRKYTRLDYTLRASSIPNVGSVTAAMGDGVRAVQVPRIKQFQIGLTSRIKAGHSLLVGCLPHLDQKNCFYVLLTPHHILDEE